MTKITGKLTDCVDCKYYNKLQEEEPCKDCMLGEFFKEIPVKETEDLVNNPKHYHSHPTGIKCIDIIEHMNLNCGTAIKYIWRNGLKSEEGMRITEKQIQDLEKAKWYVEREIARIKHLQK